MIYNNNNVGWGSADFLGTRLLPLWFGARGSEFDWIYLQNSFDCNINLVSLLIICRSVTKISFF